MGTAGFSHARLSIVDLQHGQQPMMSDDSQVMLTFNGEIYNHIELRAELGAAGVRFNSRSDTEVLLRSYLHWGEDCVNHFNGEWAFAVWDNRRKRLFASRDRLGIRPLHYAFAGNDFVFGSEIKSLLLHRELHATPDRMALDDIFTFWVPVGGRTFFDGVSQLLPGHSLRLENGRLETHAYWSPDFAETGRHRNESDCLEELEALMVDSIQLRLRSDVPVGAYLSGGLDSALTTALVRKHTSANLRTFSVTFDDNEFDESRFQTDAARFLGTEHHQIRCSRTEISSNFPEVVRHIEQPVLRTAPAPMYLLSKLARDAGCKVVITGEGADEVFGGYDIFKEAKVRRFWAREHRLAGTATPPEAALPVHAGTAGSVAGVPQGVLPGQRAELKVARLLPLTSLEHDLHAQDLLLRRTCGLARRSRSRRGSDRSVAWRVRLLVRIFARTVP